MYPSCSSPNVRLDSRGKKKKKETLPITPPNDNRTYSWDENYYIKAFANGSAPKDLPIIMAQDFDAKCDCRDCVEYKAPL